MSNAKIWFITGASSGFGRAMTEHQLKSGNKVVATLRKPEALLDLTKRYPSTQLLVVKVDVTKEADVATAFTRAQEVFGRIDVVFNNAGISITAEVESLDETEARDMFEVNFWGAARVTKEAVRFFREVNKPIGGRLLQVSSFLGISGFAACGFYSASKFGNWPSVVVVTLMEPAPALEGLTESLVNELDPAWNIKATILEPGPFRTEIAQGNYRAAPPHPAYTDPALHVSQVRKLLTTAELWNGDAAKAVVAIDKLAQLEDAPIRLPLHNRVLEVIREKAKGLSEVADKYENWNKDLYHDH